jgi:hypothetical protein
MALRIFMSIPHERGPLIASDIEYREIYYPAPA